MKKLFICVAFILAAALFATGCGKQAENKTNESTTASSSQQNDNSAAEDSFSEINYTFDESTQTLTVSGNGKMAWDLHSDSYHELQDMESISNLVFSEGITEIQSFAFGHQFEGNTGKEQDHFNLIKTIKLPDTVEKIGDSAFGGTGITELTLPKSVTTICGSAFEKCEKLQTVTIPDGVKTIGAYAFSECSDMKTILVPASVIKIGENAFEDGIEIKGYRGSEAENYAKENGFTFTPQD